ncbi:MAG: nucleotidyltransferase family protein [Armatimonadota bacterium]|nr:nucleotidyltransferase family protein [Armatimonadota bacterium]MDR7400784.1 nucleotidyltransferase family protein [Armatimonadota bacterium]MDR7403879.1 nucleotidyltransferase family protein [Armatimonadota bacterium]MDR7436622.1 nucleotidyltransferase family protein [Armatimonadota bacterium]MDR7472959.1 nucleotidyltransferase family protein [Armatimonadota bacterium]
MYAIILAGGKGERLRPFTSDRPKPMVEVLGVPILGYQLQWLQTQGVTDIIIACGYRHEVIQDYFGTGEKWGVRIRYAVESQPLGRGGALKMALGLVGEGEDICLATNGDIITNVRIKPLLQTHRASGCVATVVLTPFISPYGIVEVDDEDRIVAFHEKPELPYWVNAGIYVLAREIEPLLPDQGDHEDSTFPRLASERRLAAFKSRAYWRAVDTVKDLSEVHKELEQRLMTSFLA